MQYWRWKKGCWKRGILHIHGAEESRYCTNTGKLDVSICEFIVCKSHWVPCLFNPIECLHLSTPPQQSSSTSWNWVQNGKHHDTLNKPSSCSVMPNVISRYLPRRERSMREIQSTCNATRKWKGEDCRCFFPRYSLRWILSCNLFDIYCCSRKEVLTIRCE